MIHRISTDRAFAGCLAGILVACLAVVPVSAHPSHSFNNLFHDVSLREACALASQECKLVCVYVTKPNGRACKYLELPTWRDWRVIDLLILETVVIKLDARRDADQLARYKLDELPVILLLNVDGSERRRLSGTLSADQFAIELSRELNADDSVARVRQAVQQAGDQDFLARERLAATLARHGAWDDALREYRWCLEVGLQQKIPFATTRRRLVLKKFVELTEQYPPARKVLEERRAALERTLRDERDDVNLARTLAELNLCLNNEARTLALFDELPAGRRARRILFDRVLEQLIQHQRYDEVLALVDPLQTFAQEAHLAKLSRVRGGEQPEARQERGTRAFAIARGATLVEALAGVERSDEARALIDRILAYDNTPPTRELLKHHAEQAASPELVKYIEETARDNRQKTERTP